MNVFKSTLISVLMLAALTGCKSEVDKQREAKEEFSITLARVYACSVRPLPPDINIVFQCSNPNWHYVSEEKSTLETIKTFFDRSSKEGGIHILIGIIFVSCIIGFFGSLYNEGEPKRIIRHQNKMRQEQLQADNALETARTYWVNK